MASRLWEVAQRSLTAVVWVVACFGACTAHRPFADSGFGGTTNVDTDSGSGGAPVADSGSEGSPTTGTGGASIRGAGGAANGVPDGSPDTAIDRPTTDPVPDAAPDASLEAGPDVVPDARPDIVVPPPIEDCTNGTDDDGDGKIDCDDADCTQFACVPRAPIGWSGPVAALRSDGDGCQAGFVVQRFVGHAGLQFDPPTCPACACSPPSSIKCILAPSSESSTCSGLPVDQASAGGCVAKINASTSSVYVPATTVLNQICEVTSPVPAILPVSWASKTVLCGTPSQPAAGGCSPSTTCLPIPAAPFGSRLCLFQAGDILCPPGGMYPVRQIVFAGVIDTRVCSPCQCGPFTGVTCQGGLFGYDDNDCFQNSLRTTLYDTAQGCYATSGRSFKVTLNAQGVPVCPPPTGGAASGTAVSDAITTICCSS